MVGMVCGMVSYTNKINVFEARTGVHAVGPHW